MIWTRRPVDHATGPFTLTRVVGLDPQVGVDSPDPSDGRVDHVHDTQAVVHGGHQPHRVEVVEGVVGEGVHTSHVAHVSADSAQDR